MLLMTIKIRFYRATGPKFIRLCSISIFPQNFTVQLFVVLLNLFL